MNQNDTKHNAPEKYMELTCKTCSGRKDSKACKNCLVWLDS